MNTKYEVSIGRFLFLYRYFTFVLAAGIIQQRGLWEGSGVLSLQTYIVLILFGIYTVLKVAFPIRWLQKDFGTYVVFGADLVLCIFLVLITGGVNSGFLLYSLTPIFTAAFLFDQKISLAAASASSVFLVIAHLVLSRFTSGFAWLFQSNTLAEVFLYSAFSLTVATLAYKTNVNIRTRVEAEAIRDERRRLRQEIHDVTAQALNFISLKAARMSSALSSGQLTQAAKDLEEMQETVRETYEDIRESLDQLSSDPEGLALVPAIASHLNEFEQRTGVKVHFSSLKAPFPFPPIADLQLLRIAQEALVNVRKHAKAGEVWVALESSSRGLTMTIKDNGVGFLSSDDGEDASTHHGLKVMRERAESIGGTFTVKSAPGEGTEVSVSLPSAM